MKCAFLFPGQGTQVVGMGKDLYEKYEKVRDVFRKASEIAQIDIAKLCFEGKREEYKEPYIITNEEIQEGYDLNQTENTQLAIATLSLAILGLCKEAGIEAQMAVGLSLGEYPALVYGEKISFADAIFLLKQRGYYMQHYLPKETFQMLAVIGLEESVIEAICEKIEEQGYFIQPANYNCKGQVVISGEEKAIQLAQEQLKEAGAKKTVVLNTSGPFHTRKLEEAAKQYRKDLEKVSFAKGNSCVVLKNIDGTPYQEEENMVDILTKHIISPVHFEQEIQQMLQAGVDTFIELGPGKTLTGFVKRESKQVSTYCVNNVETFEDLCEKFKKEE